MLTRYILRLRQSPKAVRNRHAFFIATGCTVVVGLLWLVTLPMTLEKSPAAEGEAASSSRPLASFFTRARDQAAQLIGSFKEQASSSSTTSVAVDSDSAATSSPPSITLTEEELTAARASATIPYIPPATTTPRVIRIATTSISVGVVASTTTSSTP